MCVRHVPLHLWAVVARDECWIDPLSLPPQKAMERIGMAYWKQKDYGNALEWMEKASFESSRVVARPSVKAMISSIVR